MSEEPLVKEWRPHPVQEEFSAIPFSVFEAFFGGAAGPGKTELLLMLPILYGFTKHPRFKGIIFRRTFPELDKEIIRRSHEFYPAAGGKYNSQDRLWRFASGAFMDFGHCERESDIRKYDTAQYNYVAFDELTSFTEFQYLYMAASRCRSSSTDLPAIVRSASNPGNVGHGWVRKRFVEPCREGRTILRDTRTGQKRIFIPARLSDNPYLQKADPNYGARLELLPNEAERKAKLYGDWWTYEGQVFDEWRLEPFPGEPSSAQHVIKPYEIPEWYPRILAIDWGYRAMLWAGWGAVTPDSQLVLYREYARKKTKISTWATDIAAISASEKLASVVIDPSAWQQRGDEKHIAEQFIDWACPPLPKPKRADNDRVGGKMLLHEYLRWQQLPKTKQLATNYDQGTAARVLRIHGVDAYNDYLKSFEPQEDETNLPKLRVFDTCPRLIDAISKCVYDETNKEDVAEFEDDDPYDGMRYLIKEAHHYVSRSRKGEDEYQARAGIQRQFEVTHDWTSFYRQMESMEAKKREGQPKATRSFH